jgi:hypothetical protein
VPHTTTVNAAPTEAATSPGRPRAPRGRATRCRAAEHQDLRPGRATGGIDELGEEGEEEERDLGVEYVHEHGLPVGAREAGRAGFVSVRGWSVAARERAEAEVEEVGGAEVADGVERELRGGEQRREPDRGGADVDEAAGFDPERGEDGSLPSLLDAAGDDVDDVRPGDDDQDERGEREGNQRSCGRHRLLLDSMRRL